MERKREATRILLEEGLKELMRTRSFDKITVKMITDEAGVLRPTFYNYYRDKYELLEGVFQGDIGERMEELIQDGMEEDAIRVLFLRLERDRAFYKKAFEITGQNSFEEILEQYLYQMFMECLLKYPLKTQPGIKIWKEEVIAKYYSISLASVIKGWITEDKMEMSADEVTKGYYLLLTHSIFDLIDKKEHL
ncbi:TetR/AcrR family transcriptional regulator C-terminal domain-containing protein [Qiania dongpingensis]|uniref:TetR/AcrR family transcriptional regulator C-terminal domain-containing protein n=1 Tax=Qiania dongpingensis TaxID=2763669 RepID=A0A7G9G1Y5_9FIRM|nr:TetR/AcrR family transcriptional regulator C-terminal domain-containing protein [Qiania dongpingensis]QNM04817.1 TetR/AcrR family transcriptional regulator C-terminal domain-containing protein [Qiania dongpingensis]